MMDILKFPSGAIDSRLERAAKRLGWHILRFEQSLNTPERSVFLIEAYSTNGATIVYRCVGTEKFLADFPELRSAEPA